MRHPDDSHDPVDAVDARLRDALEPAPGAVERLVRRAMSPEAAGGTPAVPGKSTEGAGAPAGLHVPQDRAGTPALPGEPPRDRRRLAGPHGPRDRRRPAGLRRLLPAAAIAASLLVLVALALLRPEPPPPQAAITITNVGGVVVATSPAGPHWLIRSEPGAAAPAGSVLILRRDEP